MENKLLHAKQYPETKNNKRKLFLFLFIDLSSSVKESAIEIETTTFSGPER